jgi:hypothetical protein
MSMSIDLADKRHVAIAACGVIACVLAALALYAGIADHSRVLDAQETEALRAWVLSTQDAQVADAFNEVASDGMITADEAAELMETAKAADLPPGLYQPVAN